MSMEVRLINSADAKPWVEEIHYARRKVGAVHRFGLFEEGTLTGVILYSIPAGVNVCESVCGPLHAGKVLTLSRLVCKSESHNASSFLIANSLKLLPRPSIVISFADQNASHVGYVYQAANAIYTGVSDAGRFYHMEDGTVKPVRRHVDAEKVVETTRQLPKHRYVFITGSRSQKRRLRKALLYPVLPYPKGASSSTHGHRSRRVRRIEYRACLQCSGHLPPRRADAKYCSAACRALAHYHRQKLDVYPSSWSPAGLPQNEAASFNPPGWTCWRRAVWLGLLTA